MCGHILTVKKKIAPTTEARRISNDAFDLVAVDRWNMNHRFLQQKVKYLWTNQGVGMYARAIQR